MEPISGDFGLLIQPSEGETFADVQGSWILELLASREGGLLLFRGFDVDERAFVRFTEKFGTDFLVHHNTEGRDYVGNDMTVATVAKSNKPIDFHIEMASNPIRPDVLWFYCVAPAVRKGRIGFVDGRVVLENLTTRTRTDLQSRGFKYEFRQLPPEIWRPVWLAIAGEHNVAPRRVLRLIGRFGRRFGVSGATIDKADRISLDYAVNPIYLAPLCGEEVFACGLLDNPRRTLMGDGSQVERAAYIEVAQATYQNAVWLDWRAGDVAIVDNTRVMHSREAFEDTQRRVLIRYSALKCRTRTGLACVEQRLRIVGIGDAS
jgi:alpha-ketoglutarate-dependent taurine dioxygenase